ncbi:MAG: GNAT family N-acetyltransferase [Lachnospiraceae bacterium]|nr:GNAT family N-acetyltransferase [Lachnospiraceae bacterium]
MRILKASQKDLQEILNLQYLAYQREAIICNNPNIPPLSQTLKDLETEFETYVFLKVVNEDGCIVASVRTYSDNGTLYIGKLMVLPDLQGRGIGTGLLKAIEQVCPHKRYELFTSTKSERNIKLYERLGYVKFREQDAGNDLRFIYLCKTTI